MSKLTPIFIDLETFWSAEHSLSKTNPILYCRHPETEIISIALKHGNRPAWVEFGEQSIQNVLDVIDWSDKLVIGHNLSGFDAMILAWRFGVRPAMWGCTLAMARPRHAKTTGLSLAKLVAHYGLGVKDASALHNTKGRHYKDFTPAEIAAMREYNRADVEQCAALFEKLLPLTDKREMKLIDLTIRMLTEPAFHADTALLRETLAKERGHKHNMLLELAQRAGTYWPDMSDLEIADVTRDTLASAAKFTELLRSLGVTAPTKPSPTNPDKLIPALAKTDQAFLDLQEHPDEVVQMAARARLGVKSTQLESRLESFIEVADACDGLMPVALNYYGADTTGRDSGTFGLNQQNLPRVIPGQPKLADALRNSLTAPPGHKVVVADLSGIELRVNLTLWKTPYAMALYASDPQADLYKPLAADVFGVPVDGMPKMVRQAGKAMHLGCGFGLGRPEKYVAAAKALAQIDVSEAEAARHIEGYRKKHPEVVQGWRTCHDALMTIYTGGQVAIDPWGLCRATKEGIVTPRGVIRYPGLRTVPGTNGRLEWMYGEGRHMTRIYAGKITENIVQHLARGILMDNLLAVKKETGRNAALRVHDELVYIVPEAEAEQHLAIVQRIMRTPPAWWPELVVWSEGDIADTYGAAK